MKLRPALSTTAIWLAATVALGGCGASGVPQSAPSSPSPSSAAPSPSPGATAEGPGGSTGVASPAARASEAATQDGAEEIGTAAAAPEEASSPSPAPVPAPDAAPEPTGRDAAVLEGWTMDYFEGFDATLADTGWEPYGWSRLPVGDGGLGVRATENAFTRDGVLVLRNQYADGEWTAGGTSTEGVFTASRGRWEVRARFPESRGIGYCFLLWPADQGWPPEIDFAEGTATDPSVMGTYHWDPDNKQEQRFYDNPDMSGWHTYGVIVEDDRIIFTFDGREVERIEHPGVTTKQMFLGLQAAPLDPQGQLSQWEMTVDGGVPGPLTPVISDVEIDWVAHYTSH